MILATARLRLRKAEPRDLDDLHAIYGDPRAMRYWSTPPDADIAATKKRLDGQIAQSDPPGYLVIEHDGRVIGNGGASGDCNLGYILHPDHWGAGIMREALGALVPYLFDTLDLPFLLADADPRNLASIGLMTRMGFEVCGFAHRNFMVGGTACDTVYLRLARPGS